MDICESRVPPPLTFSEVKQGVYQLFHSQPFKSKIAEKVGGYVGGTLVSKVATVFLQKTPYRLLVNTGAVASLMSAGILLSRADTPESRKWAAAILVITSIAITILFIYPNLSLAAGMIIGDELDKIIGSLIGGYLGLKAMGSEMPFIDFENPSKSYVGSNLPLEIVLTYAKALMPFQNQILGELRDFGLSQLTAHIISLGANSNSSVGKEYDLDNF